MKYFLLTLLIFFNAFSFPNFFNSQKNNKVSIEIKVVKEAVKMYWLKLEKGGYIIVGNPPEKTGCREISDLPIDKLRKAIKRNLKTGKKTLFVKSINAEIYLGKEPVYDDGRKFHIYGFNPTTGISLKEYNKFLKIKEENEKEFKNLMKNWMDKEELPEKLWLICKKREFSQKEIKYTVKIYPISLEIKKPDIEIKNIRFKDNSVEMVVNVFPFFPVKSQNNTNSLNLNPFQRDINIAFNLKLENPPKLGNNIYLVLIPKKINGNKISFLYSWWGKKEKFAVGSERIYQNPIKIEFKICKVRTKSKNEIDVLNEDLDILDCSFKTVKNIHFKGSIKFIIDANFNDNIPDIWTKNEPEWIGTPVNRKPKEFIKLFELKNN